MTKSQKAAEKAMEAVGKARRLIAEAVGKIYAAALTEEVLGSAKVALVEVDERLEEIERDVDAFATVGEIDE